NKPQKAESVSTTLSSRSRPPKYRCSGFAGAKAENSDSSCCSTRHVSDDSRSFKCLATRRSSLRLQRRLDVCVGSDTISVKRRCTDHLCSPTEVVRVPAETYASPERSRIAVSSETVRPKSSSLESAGHKARTKRTRVSTRSA